MPRRRTGQTYRVGTMQLAIAILAGFTIITSPGCGGGGWSKSLYGAAHKGNIKSAERYLDEGESINAPRAEDGRTPLHAAASYATLARSGANRAPTLVSNSLPRASASIGDDLPLDEALVTAALEGLRQAVSEEYGSANHIRYADGTTQPIINAVGVTVWAKTGTAEAPPLAVDSNGDGEIDESDQPVTALDHAWFVGLVGPQADGRPHYALAVLVEHGGSGSKVAGPIANQIIRALQVEGYLPADAAPPPSLEGEAGQ